MLRELAQAIPIDDQSEALRFCRALAAALRAEPTKSEAPAPVISVVVPVFNEQANIHALYERLAATFAKLDLRFELVFVDDGSSDGSVALLRDLCARDGRLVAIELARNFGQQTALTAGLDFTRGEAVILMDADLQDSPEAIPELIKTWREGYEVVYALRVRRKERLTKRLSYAVFYRLLRIVADIRIPLDTGDFCIMDRKVVEQLRAMSERTRFLRGIRSWVGFRQKGIHVERSARNEGSTKYTIDKLISLALDGLISFSVKPLRMISFFGLSISLGSLVLALVYALQKVTIGLSPPGFATIVVLLGFLSGVQLITIGLIGEYVGRIFEETKRRPLYVIRTVHRKI